MDDIPTTPPPVSREHGDVSPDPTSTLESPSSSITAPSIGSVSDQSSAHSRSSSAGRAGSSLNTRPDRLTLASTRTMIRNISPHLDTRTDRHHPPTLTQSRITSSTFAATSLAPGSTPESALPPRPVQRIAPSRVTATQRTNTPISTQTSQAARSSSSTANSQLGEELRIKDQTAAALRRGMTFDAYLIMKHKEKVAKRVKEEILQAQMSAARRRGMTLEAYREMKRVEKLALGRQSQSGSGSSTTKIEQSTSGSVVIPKGVGSIDQALFWKTLQEDQELKRLLSPLNGRPLLPLTDNVKVALQSRINIIIRGMCSH
ncbi:hypothetical protein CI109_100299 [Kwoniella shandongensis]|uniref:Uncharacterized protein n=1 Tax=Kwoniella shandongensis TaxID=1734106 RepID=A0A5M6C469_9TREE|nr:uncharacterized protein CI109_001856 [Kwoniella shandongensis]KAA5529916.1 hypothetical protein CI109_001856 [Kwoniella shandongensis]